jgi:hypothetical protein
VVTVVPSTLTMRPYRSGLAVNASAMSARSSGSAARPILERLGSRCLQPDGADEQMLAEHVFRKRASSHAD